MAEAADQSTPDDAPEDPRPLPTLTLTLTLTLALTLALTLNPEQLEERMRWIESLETTATMHRRYGDIGEI